jgi:hypothetical protein
MAMSYKRRGKTWLFTVNGVVSRMLLDNAVYRIASMVLQWVERGTANNDRREGGGGECSLLCLLFTRCCC